MNDDVMKRLMETQTPDEIERFIHLIEDYDAQSE
jgi:hypothetical protein